MLNTLFWDPWPEDLGRFLLLELAKADPCQKESSRERLRSGTAYKAGTQAGQYERSGRLEKLISEINGLGIW
jgi:hypothetical protein